MNYLRLLLTPAILMGLALSSHAQVLGTGVMPVVEVGANLTQSTISAIQNVITAAQTTLIQANQIIDLTPVKSLTAAGGIVEDIELMCDIIKQAEALNADVQSLERQISVLLDLEQAPRTRSELDARMAELKAMKRQALTFAFRSQTLIRTLIRTGDHMRELFADVEKLLGNLSGQQRLAEVQQVQNKTLAVLAAQTAAWQRSEVIDRASADMIRESLSRIGDQRLADWPRWE
jgi:D-serine deaminase-like pyridoxal phosphate-dependent protein